MTNKYFPPQTPIAAGRNRKVEVTLTKEKIGRVPDEVWNSGSQRFEDRTTGRAMRGVGGEPTAEALQRAGIISSDPNAKRARPAGSSPALRIACPSCGALPGAYCIKFSGRAERVGQQQTIAHKKRREEEERTRG